MNELIQDSPLDENQANTIHKSALKILIKKSTEGFHIIQTKENSDFFLLQDRVMGFGTFSEIRKVHNLSTNTELILKSTRLMKSDEGLKNENRILSSLKKNNINLTGIQKPYRYQIKDDLTYKGFIGKEYDGDLSSKIKKDNLTDMQKMQCAQQLLTGLKTLHENNILHGDIKPDNCLVKQEGDAIKCVIADFGGATTDRSTPQTHTKTYLPKKYLKLFSTNDSKPSQAYKLALSRDIYAMGKTLSELFEGSEKLPKGLSALISNMMNDSYEKRPTAEEVLARFSELIKPPQSS